MDIAYYIIGLLIVIVCCETAELILKHKQKQNEQYLPKKSIKRDTATITSSFTYPKSIKQKRDDKGFRNVRTQSPAGITPNPFRVSNIKLVRINKRQDTDTER